MTRLRKTIKANDSFLPTATLRCQRIAESTKTTLTEAMAAVIPGVKLRFAKLKVKGEK